MEDQRSHWESVSLALLDDPHNLRLWQSLIHSSESEKGLINKTSNDVEIRNLRLSYETFLGRYPLFLKYWMAYAFWERRLDHNDKAETIFVRALQFGCYDVSLWIAYLKFKIETLTNNIDHILQLFEAARLKIGYHYHSFEFYQLYLEFLYTYESDENNFKKKYILLLRIMLEIPLYGYSTSFEHIMSFVSSSSSTIEDLSQFMHATNLKALKTSLQNNKNLMYERIKKHVADTYVVNQAKSYELFSYERILTSNHPMASTPISFDQVECWKNYINTVECAYPFEYITQLYERSLLATRNHPEIVLKYCNFCIDCKKLGKARYVLRKAIPFVERGSNVQLLLRLSDLEVATGNVLSAKDLITGYISVNSNVPNIVFQKLMQIELLINPSDEKYICLLAHEILIATKSAVILEMLCNFPVSKETLKSYFLKFVKGSTESYRSLATAIDLNSFEFFWRTLKTLTENIDLEGVQFPEKFK